ncbi:MAG: DMT family transporter [Oscillospiraceae bacterium]|nr:DMT family transporter [Oscillospiraceae bacterium]
MSQSKNGPFLIFLGSVCFSLGGLFTKLLPWQALSIGSGRCILSTILIGCFMVSQKHRLVFNKTVLFGGFCLCGTVTFYVLANKMTSAANAIVLQYSAPIFIILFMWLFFHNRPGKLDLAACAVVTGGIVLFFVDGLDAGGMTGNLVALLSGVCYALVCMLNAFPGGDPISSVFLGHLMSAVIGLPSLAQETDFSAAALGCILMLGVFQLGLGYILFTKGLETTQPISASLISTVEPILNPILVAVFYGEAVTPLEMVGGAVVIGAVVVYNIMKTKQSRQKTGAAVDQ